MILPTSELGSLLDRRSLERQIQLPQEPELGRGKMGGLRGAGAHWSVCFTETPQK